MKHKKTFKDTRLLDRMWHFSIFMGYKGFDLKRFYCFIRVNIE